MGNKKKLFVISDVHGFYDEMIKALNEAGFDKDNPSHLLISCGDNLDRGEKPREVIEYLSSIENKVLIKGNHDSMFVDMCMRHYPSTDDFYNGTFKTMLDLNMVNSGKVKPDDFEGYFDSAYRMYKPLIDSMCNFYETKNYIFVHSWIPVKLVPNHEESDKYVMHLEYYQDWRNADPYAWDEAMWNNPYEYASERLNQTNKTMVFGHWHTSWYWSKFKGIGSEDGDDAKFDIVNDEDLKIIGIDACTAYTGKVNVAVLEDELID